MRRPELRFLALVIFVNAILLISSPLLPFIDLPNHLAEATIFKKDRLHLSDYYTSVPWYFPNTFHTMFCSLFPSVEIGNKAFFILYIIMLQSSMYLIIRELGGNIWYGMLSVLFIYNYNVTYGFTGFAISMPTLLIFFFLLLRDIRMGGIRYKIAASICLFLLFLMHAQVTLLALVVFGMIMLFQYRRDWRQLLLHVFTIPIPVVILLIFWWFTRDAGNESSTISYLLDYYRNQFFPTFFYRYRFVFFDNFQLQAGHTGLFIGMFFTFLLVIPLLVVKFWKRLPSSRASARPFVYPVILFLSIFACYLLLPHGLPGQAPLYERFTTLLLLSFILIGSLLLKDVAIPWLRPYVIAAALIYTIAWGEYLYSFNKTNRHFNASFFVNTEDTAILGGLIYDHRFRGRQVYIHFPNYFIVWKKGLATSMIIDYRFGVVRRGYQGKNIPPYDEKISDRYHVNRSYLQTIDYLLTRGKAPVDPDENLAQFNLIKEAGPWKLFRRKNNYYPKLFLRK